MHLRSATAIQSFESVDADRLAHGHHGLLEPRQTCMSLLRQTVAKGHRRREQAACLTCSADLN